MARTTRGATTAPAIQALLDSLWLGEDVLVAGSGEDEVDAEGDEEEEEVESVNVAVETEAVGPEERVEDAAVVDWLVVGCT